MKVLVTGAVGFIGSRLSEHLLSLRHEVVGVDSIDSYYEPKIKTGRLSRLCKSDAFSFSRIGVAEIEAEGLLKGVDAVIHLAGRPGVRGSWGPGFADYARENITSTQLLLEAVKAAGCPRYVYASSSSVYGDLTGMTASEHQMCRPESPYGVSKYAGELLGNSYAANYGFRCVSLRLFTVFGGGQRPDMAFQRIIGAGETGTAFRIYGTGTQKRDFTHVQDVCRAFEASLRYEGPSTVFNVSGGVTASLIEAIRKVESIIGRDVQLVYEESKPGDVKETRANSDAAKDELDWTPRVTLCDGLREQIDHFRSTKRVL